MSCKIISSPPRGVSRSAHTVSGENTRNSQPTGTENWADHVLGRAADQRTTTDAEDALGRHQHDSSKMS